MLWYCHAVVSGHRTRPRHSPRSYFFRLDDPHNIFRRLNAFQGSALKLFDNGTAGKRLTHAFPKHTTVTMFSLMLHYEPPTPLSFEHPPIIFEREIRISEKRAPHVVHDSRHIRIVTQDAVRYMESATLYWWVRDIVYFLFDVYPASTVRVHRSHR